MYIIYSKYDGGQRLQLFELLIRLNSGQRTIEIITTLYYQYIYRSHVYVILTASENTAFVLCKEQVIKDIIKATIKLKPLLL